MYYNTYILIYVCVCICTLVYKRKPNAAAPADFKSWDISNTDAKADAAGK